MKKKILHSFLRILITLSFIVFFLFLLSINWVVGILGLFCFFYLRLILRFSLPSGGCYLWLGVPGSGKTTCAAWIARHYKDSDYRVFSNVPIKGTYKYDWKHDFGRYDMSKSIIICDEAGICLNGRNWKDNFDKKSLEVIKKFRHYEMTLHFFSQANDEDPIIRNLSMVTYVVEKSLVPYFVRYRVIASRIDINEQTHKHDTCEFWKPLSKRLVFCPPAWKLFDTLDCEKLPDRDDWNMW